MCPLIKENTLSAIIKKTSTKFDLHVIDNDENKNTFYEYPSVYRLSTEALSLTC